MKKFLFGSLLWESALKSWGGIIGILGFLASVLSYFIIPAESVIKTKFVMIVIMVITSILIIAIRAAWIATERSNQISNIPSPKVIHVINAIKPYCNCHALFIIDSTSLLPYDALVSVYYLEHGFEKFVGLGKVINVQDDKKVQVIITDNYDFEDKLEKIKGNLSEDLAKLIIKTSIPSSILQGGLNDR
uniref:hypothetical protein n=1 Tax=Psychrobacter sp. TaxID=56811 RepID=UPI00159AE6C9|nr:hypothetical protein [Psychrobacter sp.]QJS05494.1 hypothetical protein [Psychrobacter sp.]